MKGKPGATTWWHCLISIWVQPWYKVHLELNLKSNSKFSILISISNVAIWVEPWQKVHLCLILFLSHNTKSGKFSSESRFMFFYLCLVQELSNSLIRTIVPNKVVSETKQKFSSQSFIPMNVCHIFHHRPRKCRWKQNHVFLWSHGCLCA